MKLATSLTILMVAAMVLSGCSGKSATPTPSTSATVTTRPTSSGTSSPTTATDSEPSSPLHSEVYEGSLSYKTPENDPDEPMGIHPTTTRLDIRVYVNTTEGAWTVTAPSGQGKPYVEVKVNEASGSPPSSTKLEFTGASGYGAGTLTQQPLTATIEDPAATDWLVGVRGSGNNVHADIRIVATYG